jgi:hypothetical protein
MAPLEWISWIGNDDCKAAILSPFPLGYAHLSVCDLSLFIWAIGTIRFASLLACGFMHNLALSTFMIGPLVSCIIHFVEHDATQLCSFITDRWCLIWELLFNQVISLKQHLMFKLFNAIYCNKNINYYILYVNRYHNISQIQSFWTANRCPAFLRWHIFRASFFFYFVSCTNISKLLHGQL